ncbi:RNA-directed DNA polymerase, eukaryota, reverse transcriptase zinc-binding domain protein [Tanacetum coccineum]
MSNGNKQKEVQIFIKNEKLHVCSIIETHIKAKRVKDVYEKVFGRWEWTTNSHLSTNSCRIMVSWNPQEVKIHVIHVARQSILCHAESIQGKFKVFCTFVYASNDKTERKMLWNDLYCHKRISGNNSWVILGDMNVTLNIEEHSSGGSHVTEEMQDFRDCINAIEIEVIGCSSFFYTWSKSLRNADNNVLKKLDRIMVSERFANYTADKPEFIAEVKKGWNTQVQGHKMYCLVKKLKSLKPILNKLNWKNRDLTTRVEALRVKLQEAQSLVERDPHNSVIKSRAIDVLFQYNEAVKDVEKLLTQKVRIDWLNEEDKNSAFYHKVIKGRRSRNRVDTICDENEVKFIQEEVPIQFVKHFQQFLRTSYEASVLSAGDDLFCNTLTHEEDDFMVRKISDNEVKEAMFDIGDNRAPRPDEIMRGYDRKNGPKRCAMKIDLRKAYDTINWGERSKTGRPYVSYLFTLVMEVLTLLLQRRIKNNNGFKYHYRCKEIKLVNLCFADDLMTFCNGDSLSAGVIKEALQEFSAVLGLFPNLNKSTLYFGSLIEAEKDQIKHYESERRLSSNKVFGSSFNQ